MGPGLIAGFLLGVAGSAHCVGMCGPLLMSLPHSRGWLGPVYYHFGRISMYGLGGILFGTLGRGIYLAGWQQGLSITLGALILLITLTRLIGKRFSLSFKSIGLYQWVQRQMAALWKSPSPVTFLAAGAANGLLPCGMVYVAIAMALTSASALGSAAFMLCFGLGTIPMLMGLQVSGRMVSVPVRYRIRRLLPYLTACVAVLLILRGLNLGIPFVSPVLASRPSQAVICH